MKNTDRKALFNTLEVIEKIDWNYFVISQISNSTDMTGDDKNKAVINRFRSIIRYKKMLGYDTKTDSQVIKEIKKLL